MGCRASKAAAFAVGLVLLGGCGATESEPAEGPAPGGQPAASRQQAPDKPRTAEQELSPARRVMLRQALGDGIIDSKTHVAVADGLQHAAEPKPMSEAEFGPVGAPHEGLPESHTLPPLPIRLAAEPNGELAAVRLGEIRLASLHELAMRLREILSDETAEATSVELDCDPQLRYRYLVDVLEALHQGSQGRSFVSFQRGVQEVPYPQLCEFMVNGPVPEGPAGASTLGVAVSMTANEDGLLRRIVVQGEIDLGDDLGRLGRTVAEMVEVARAIEKAGGTDLRVRIDLSCSPGLHSGYLPAVIGVLARYRLLHQIDSLDLVGSGRLAEATHEQGISLRRLRRREPIEFDEFDEIEELDELDEEPLEDVEIDLEEIDPTGEPVDVQEVTPADDFEQAAIRVELSDFGLDPILTPDDSRRGSFGNLFSGRGRVARHRLVRKYGGSPGSERAVAAALKWLAEHQMPDGGWSFDHTQCPSCRRQCRNPGTLAKARLGATAMAVLPFLGAGQTHKEGKYKSTVKNGLYFLVRGMKVDQKGGSMHESGGRMYSHGLGSIALCEAYAMTRDKGLHRPAQAAVDFICYAQDPVGGGWRYEPRQPGDTSVTGWQIMALKSGQMACLRIPPLVVAKAFRYLDGVQANNGATYGYTGPGEGRATTAIGLLCRTHLGWKKDNPALQRGVQKISEWGPLKDNMYYNYYATQLMRHIEFDLWKKWNGVMRDRLVSSQATQGHEAGSWFIKGGDHGAGPGGRLYFTSMATMVLEVYYRHMPIFQEQAVEDDFPNSPGGRKGRKTE